MPRTTPNQALDDNAANAIAMTMQVLALPPKDAKPCTRCGSVMELERSPHADVKPLWVCTGRNCPEVHHAGT